MAIVRKVINLNYDELDSMYIFATGIVLISNGITCFYVHKLPDKDQIEPPEKK
ncbi:hypothetical protein [Desulfosediminicola flagellatus]|uniref:hypothetical protein n=1 Tax=Desulfosediminicola flagellatus TaxID=2569541 RepID=UPI002687DB0C